MFVLKPVGHVESLLDPVVGDMAGGDLKPLGT
jgi:hypothetical protein